MRGAVLEFESLLIPCAGVCQRFLRGPYWRCSAPLSTLLQSARISVVFFLCCNAAWTCGEELAGFARSNNLHNDTLFRAQSNQAFRGPVFFCMDFFADNKRVMFAAADRHGRGFSLVVCGFDFSFLGCPVSRGTRGRPSTIFESLVKGWEAFPLRAKVQCFWNRKVYKNIGNRLLLIHVKKKRKKTSCGRGRPGWFNDDGAAPFARLRAPPPLMVVF